MPPAALLLGPGEHVAERLPETERTVADRKDRRLHAAPLARPEQVRPALTGLTEPIGERNELLGAPSADTENDEQTHLVLLEPELQVDPVDPHVDVVGAGQGPLVEGALLVLPLGS